KVAKAGEYRLRSERSRGGLTTPDACRRLVPVDDQRRRINGQVAEVHGKLDRNSELVRRSGRDRQIALEDRPIRNGDGDDRGPREGVGRDGNDQAPAGHRTAPVSIDLAAGADAETAARPAPQMGIA